MDMITVIWFGLELRVPTPILYPSLCIAVDNDGSVYAYEFPPFWNEEFGSWVAHNGRVWCCGPGCFPKDFEWSDSLIAISKVMIHRLSVSIRVDTQ